MIIVISTLILAIAGSVAYRCGGSGNYPRFWRELGQGCMFMLEMISMRLVLWAWEPILGTILGFGVCWAESTYFKKTGANAVWWNWLLVGAVFGLVPLPFCALTNSCWIGFGIRMVICPLLTVWWQQSLSKAVCDDINLVLVPMGKPKIGKDITDEFGRGFINIATLPLLLV